MSTQALDSAAVGCGNLPTCPRSPSHRGNQRGVDALTDSERAELIEILSRSLAEQNWADPEAIEGFWISRIREFFAKKPFTIKLDSSRSDWRQLERPANDN